MPKWELYTVKNALQNFLTNSEKNSELHEQAEKEFNFLVWWIEKLNRYKR